MKLRKRGQGQMRGQVRPVGVPDLTQFSLSSVSSEGLGELMLDRGLHKHGQGWHIDWLLI